MPYDGVRILLVISPLPLTDKFTNGYLHAEKKEFAKDMFKKSRNYIRNTSPTSEWT